MAMDFPMAVPETDANADASSSYANNSAFMRRESVSIGGEQATAELARGLPELIEQLRLLRVQMEKSAKVYDAISSGQLKTHESVSSSNGSMSNSGKHQSSSSSSMVGAGRQSIFTPFADSSDSDRASIVSPPDAYADVPINRHSAPLELGELSGGPQLARQTSQQMQQMQQMQQQQRQARPMQRMPSMVMRNVDYTVMWVSGECGISLRNFSTNKIGAQIAVLQQAEGVTTGIANCRLGDQLISVNDDQVEVSTFKDIVQKLKTTRRPITLGFRTNPNVATSPRASASSALTRSASSRFSAPPRKPSSTRGFFPAEEETRSSAPSANAVALPAPVYSRSSSSSNNNKADEAAARSSEERQTDTSVRSSTSTISDEMEVWCKEQEEMHSDIIVLLTETVMRCEKLQQENMDQLQNWMQVAPSMYSSTTSASSALTKKSSMFALMSNGSDTEE